VEVLMDSGVRPVYRKVTKLIRLWHFSSKSFHLLQVTLTFRMNCFDLLGFHLFFDTINAQNLFVQYIGKQMKIQINVIIIL